MAWEARLTPRVPYAVMCSPRPCATVSRPELRATGSSLPRQAYSWVLDTALRLASDLEKEHCICALNVWLPGSRSARRRWHMCPGCPGNQPMADSVADRHYIAAETSDRIPVFVAGTSCSSMRLLPKPQGPRPLGSGSLSAHLVETRPRGRAAPPVLDPGTLNIKTSYARCRRGSIRC